MPKAFVPNTSSLSMGTLRISSPNFRPSISSSPMMANILAESINTNAHDLHIRDLQRSISPMIHTFPQSWIRTAFLCHLSKLCIDTLDKKQNDTLIVYCVRTPTILFPFHDLIVPPTLLVDNQRLKLKKYL